MSDLIEPVGARLTLLNGPAFRAGLASATECPAGLQRRAGARRRARRRLSGRHSSRLEGILGHRRRFECNRRRCRQGSGSGHRGGLESS